MAQHKCYAGSVRVASHTAVSSVCARLLSVSNRNNDRRLRRSGRLPTVAAATILIVHALWITKLWAYRVACFSLAQV